MEKIVILSSPNFGSDFFTRPILIVGTMRSGTTLLNRILNAHPKLVFRYNQSNFLRFFCLKFNSLSERDNAVFLVDKVQKHLVNYGFSFSDQDKEQTIRFLDENGYSPSNIFSALALFELKAREGSRWGEKYAGDCREIEYFFDLYPKGQVIFIRRNISAIYSSMKKKTEGIENLEPYRRDLQIIEDCRRCNEYSRLVLERYGKDSFLIVDYENLIQSPENETKKICEFLGIGWNFAMVNPDNYVDDKGAKWDANTSFEKLKGLDPSAISRYKTHLTNADLRFIDDYMSANENMKIYGIYHSSKSELESHIKKMHKSFLAAGRYQIALFVESLDNMLPNFLYQSCFDITVITRQLANSEKHKFDIITVPQNKIFFQKRQDLSHINKIFTTKIFDFIHMDGPQFLDHKILDELKTEFNLKIFMTNGMNVEPKIISQCDELIAFSEKEVDHYKKFVDSSKIKLMDKFDFYNNILGTYYGFISRYNILTSLG